VKTLLLIGGSGFFGKCFLDSYKRGLLAKWGITKVLIMSRNSERLKIEAPELLDPSIQLLIGDVGNINFLPNADYVIHAAASTDSANYLARPEMEKKNIQAGTYNYCDLAKKFHYNSRIIYCSSGAVYGQQPASLEYLPEDFDGGDIKEMPPVKRDYAVAKRDAEKAIQILGSQGCSVSIARCFAFVGKYLPRHQHFAIGNFIEDGLKNRPIVVNANQPVLRSYMHADDLVHWLMTICHSASPLCPTYNVGSDQAVTIGELAELVAKRFTVEVNKADLTQGNIDRYIPSISKAINELGLNISIDLSAAIDKTIESIQMKKLHAS
jgi:nucleoside-diphosphate-sugar epimerase